MVTLADLEQVMSSASLRDIVEKYNKSRQMLLDVATNDRYQDMPDIGGKSASGLAAFAATAGIEGCHQMLAPAVAVAEGAVTVADMVARTEKADISKGAQRESLMRWIENKRGPDAPTLDDVLSALSVELGLGEPPSWPAHVTGS